MTPSTPATRRDALRAMARAPITLAAAGTLGSIGATVLSSCSRTAAAKSERVVLYSSADDEILRAIVEKFEKSNGLGVAVVTDTEATKTTGLVQRLLDERSAPRADVWWSSEPLGTVRLARERALDPLPPSAIPDSFPADRVGSDGLWAGFARRARVIARSTKRVAPGEEPRRLRDLIDPRWKGRIGIARPQFGTTRTQMSALLAASNAGTFRDWLMGLKSNGVRLYDGNASVVRAIAQGEIDVGLTDTDDAWAAKGNGWSVVSAFEPRDAGLRAEGELPSAGPLVMPNTVSLVNGRPNADGASRFVRFLLSPEVERLLAASDSRNIPVNPAVADEFPDLRVPNPWEPEWGRVAEASAEAMAICGEVLGT